MRLNHSLVVISLLAFIVIYSCSSEEEDPMPPIAESSVSEQNTTPPIAEVAPFEFEYNLHSSLDKYGFFKDSIQSILPALNDLMPISPYYDSRLKLQIDGVNIYSWIREDVYKPFSPIIGETEQCICGEVNNHLVMSLEMSEEYDFVEGNNFKYALLAHEFFHVFQISKSQGFDQSVFWMIEGQAATIESLYMKEYINDSNYMLNFLNQDSLEDGIQNVEEYESYEGFVKSLPLYGDISVFMNLALAKVLQEEGNTEKESFLMIFENYWESDPNEANWKIKFEQIFGITTSEFYQRLNDFKTNPEVLVPEISLSEIFEKD
ncbi:MAG: hypothetical protein ACPHL7_00045 [Flavobacteriaceae bacterium]